MATSGPAETVSVDLDSCGGCSGSTEVFNSNFVAPITISETADANLYVIIDPTHFLTTMSDGTNFTQTPNKAGTDLPLIPLIAPAGKVEFYTNTGTSGNVNIDTVTTAPQAGESPMGIRLYYDSDGRPVKVNKRYGVLGGDCNANTYASAWNGKHTSGGQNTNFGVAGYLGLDSLGTLAWIEPIDSNWTIFGVIYSMEKAASLGDTIDLTYQCTSTMPAPVSGDNFSSGAPSFTADGTRHLKLVAD